MVPYLRGLCTEKELKLVPYFKKSFHGSRFKGFVEGFILKDQFQTHRD